MLLYPIPFRSEALASPCQPIGKVGWQGRSVYAMKFISLPLLPMIIENKLSLFQIICGHVEHDLGVDVPDPLPWDRD